jgi:hypothetical protein
MESPYHLVELWLTKHHINWIRKMKELVKVRTSVHPGSNWWMPVWKHEAEHLEKHGRGTITITHQHIHDAHNWPHEEQRGGLLPILAAIATYVLPVLSGLGTAAGIAGGVASAVHHGTEAAAVGKGVPRAEPIRAAEPLRGMGGHNRCLTDESPNTTFGPTNPNGSGNRKGLGVW